jgi:hypothetical protein
LPPPDAEPLLTSRLTSVSGAVFAGIGVALVSEALRRLEVNGLVGEKPGREVRWPGECSLPRRRVDEVRS